MSACKGYQSQWTTMPTNVGGSSAIYMAPMHCKNHIWSFIGSSSKGTYDRGCLRVLRPYHRLSVQRQRVECRTWLQAAQELAKARALHNKSEKPLFRDEYSEHLFPEGQANGLSKEDVFDVIATKELDDRLMRALGVVNMDRRQEFHQVVLLGCGLDTRPQRLAWPEGTVIFEVASKEAHVHAQTILREVGARVPRGSLLRRVSYNPQEGHMLADLLEAAGYKANRLSIWVIQGLRELHLTMDQLRDLMTQISLAAAFDSLIMAELPGIEEASADNLLAEHRMHGTLHSLEDSDLWNSFSTQQLQEDVVGSRWLALCQHKQLSAAEMGILEAHTQAAQDVDEDFFDNVS